MLPPAASIKTILHARPAPRRTSVLNAEHPIPFGEKTVAKRIAVLIQHAAEKTMPFRSSAACDRFLRDGKRLVKGNALKRTRCSSDCYT